VDKNLQGENQKVSSQNENNEKIDAEVTKKTQASLISKRESTATVREFVLAWIKGEISINFPDSSFIRHQAHLDGESIDIREASKREVLAKDFFIEQVSIVSGKKPSTVIEQEKAISELYDILLSFRCGDRIKGTFGTKDDHEARLQTLEEQVSGMNTLLEELVIAVRSLQQPRH
jgi:hypothetical protein